MNILVITYWGFNDALIQAYTLPYLKFILENRPENSKLFLVTLEPGKRKQEIKELLNSEQVIKLKKQGINLLPFRYYPFGIKMIFQWINIFFKLLTKIKREKIGFIHTWCTPAGAAGYVLSALTGKPLVLDSFEPHAEPMLESGTWKKNSPAYKILFYLEKKQIRRAKGVIACVEAMKEYSKEKYGYVPELFLHKPACVDLDKFKLDERKNPELLKEFGYENNIVCVYAGKFGGSYLEKETFDFFKTAYEHWGEKFRVLLLTSHTDEEIKNYCQQSNLPFELVIKTFLPHKDVPDYMGLGDFGIVPFIPVPSKRYGSPIKTGEYLAMGLPVVITKDISDDSDLIKKENIGYVLENLGDQQYINAVAAIDKLLKEQNLRHRIRKIAEETRDFGIAKGVYKDLYNRISL